MRPPHPDDTPHTEGLHHRIVRIRAGDEPARDELLRACSDQLARRYRAARGDGALGEAGVAGEAEAPAEVELERWHAFHEGVASLPAGQREVVSLAFSRGLTHGEIAERLGGVSTETVGRHWRKALLALRRCHGRGRTGLTQPSPVFLSGSATVLRFRTGGGTRR